MHSITWPGIEAGRSENLALNKVKRSLPLKVKAHGLGQNPFILFLNI